MPDDMNTRKSGEATSSGATSPPPKKKPRILGGFEIVEKIGQGAMGAVFKARQISLDRIVALKVLPPQIAEDKDFIVRFKREARASAILNHPNIVQGIDVGQDEATGLWYFAMEFIDGPTLKQIQKKELVVPEKRVLEIALDMANALVCAEKNNLVHRDIKPDNILITERNEAKLADLGLAKKTGGQENDSGVTQAGKAIGTPYYMAPEQVRGLNDQIDIRTDMYGLGATLFHLLTGQTVFKGTTSAEIMSRTLTDKPPLAHRVHKKVSEPLSRLIARMLEKDQARRPASAADLVKQFESLLKKNVTNGPMAPVRSGTTGPRKPVTPGTDQQKPVRGASTGPRTPVDGHLEALGSGRQTFQKNNKPILVAGGAVAAIVLVALAAMLTGGKTKTKTVPSDSTQAKPERSAKGTRVARNESSAKKQSTGTTEQPDVNLVNKVAPSGSAKAYAQLSAFEGVAKNDYLGRIALVENFLKSYSDPVWNNRALILLASIRNEKLKATLQKKKSSEKKETEKQAASVAADPTAKPKNVVDKAALAKERAEALKLLIAAPATSFEEVTEALKRLNAFLDKHKGTPEEAQATKLRDGLKLKHDNILAEKEAGRSAAAETAFQQLVGSVIERLHRSDLHAAQKLIRTARKHPELELVKEKLDAFPPLFKAWEASGEAVEKGALALKDVASYELVLIRGASIKVGTSTNMKIKELKGGKLFLGGENMSIPVQLSNLAPGTKRDLARKGFKQDGVGLARQAFMELLAIGYGEGSTRLEAVRRSIEQAEKSGASAEDLASLNNLLDGASKAALEREASQLMERFNKQFEAKNWTLAMKTGQLLLDTYSKASIFSGEIGDEFRERHERAYYQGAPIQNYEVSLQEGAPMEALGGQAYKGTRMVTLYSFHGGIVQKAGPQLNCTGESFKILLGFKLLKENGGFLSEGVKIQEATLELYKTSAYSPYLELRRLVLPWEVGKASWMAASGKRKWKVPGGDTDPESAVGLNLNSKAEKAKKSWDPHWCSFDVTESLKEFVKSRENHGWRLEAFGSKKRTPHSNIVKFATGTHGKEFKFRPKLTLKFRAPRLRIKKIIEKNK